MAIVEYDGAAGHLIDFESWLFAVHPVHWSDWPSCTHDTWKPLAWRTHTQSETGRAHNTVAFFLGNCFKPKVIRKVEAHVDARVAEIAIEANGHILWRKLVSVTTPTTIAIGPPDAILSLEVWVHHRVLYRTAENKDNDDAARKPGNYFVRYQLAGLSYEMAIHKLRVEQNPNTAFYFPQYQWAVRLGTGSVEQAPVMRVRQPETVQHTV